MTEAERPGIKRRWARWRDRLRDRPIADFVYRVAVGVVGLAVLAAGIVAIPYPGPGWAIVFLGLGDPGHRVQLGTAGAAYARARYDAVMDWFKRQHSRVQALGTAFTVRDRARRRCGCSAPSAGRPDWSASNGRWLKSPLGLGS